MTRSADERRSGLLWAYDFVFDATADGRQLKCLTVIDEFTRECLAIDVAGRGHRESGVDGVSGGSGLPDVSGVRLAEIADRSGDAL
jgi:hypothetical protein